MVLWSPLDMTEASSAVDGTGTDPTPLRLTERDETTPDTSSSEGREKDLNHEASSLTVIMRYCVVKYNNYYVF